MKNTDFGNNHTTILNLRGLKYVETNACQINISATGPPGMFEIFVGALHGQFGQAWNSTVSLDHSIRWSCR